MRDDLSLVVLGVSDCGDVAQVDDEEFSSRSISGSVRLIIQQVRSLEEQDRGLALGTGTGLYAACRCGPSLPVWSNCVIQMGRVQYT